MRYVFTAIIAILIAIVIYLLLFKGREQEDIDVTQLTYLQTKVQKAENLRTIVIIKAREDSAEHAKINKSKDEEIVRLKRLAKKAKTVHVGTVIMQDKEVGDYVQYLDSIIVDQDHHVKELIYQGSEQWLSFNKLIHASDSVGNAHKDLNKVIQNTLDEQFKVNKKLRSQNRLLKVGIVAVPVAIIAVVLAK